MAKKTRRVKLDVKVTYRVGLTIDVTEDVYEGLNLVEEFDDYSANIYRNDDNYGKAINFLNDEIKESDSYEHSYKVDMADFRFINNKSTNK